MRVIKARIKYKRGTCGMKKFIAAALACMMVLLCFCACGKEESSEKLRVALQTTAQGVPAYVAERDGFNEKEGLETVSAVYATGVAQLEALGADGWDVACIGAPPAMTANIAYDAQIIAMVLNESSTELFVRSDSDILTTESGVDSIKGSAEAWKGKTILLPLNTTSHYIILSALSKVGLGASDVNLINMDVGQAYTAFKSGQSDVVTLWDPNSFTAQDEGWTSVMYGPDTGAICPCMLIASKKAIEEKPEAIKAWLKAYFGVVEDPAFTKDALASATFEFFNANDVDITEEESHLFAERKEFFDLGEAYGMFFDKAEDGKTLSEEYMYSIAEFFYEQGSYSEADLKKVTDGDLFYTDFIKEIYEESQAK